MLSSASSLLPLDEKLRIEMRVLSALKVARQETFVKMIDEGFKETMGVRFKTKDMANQVTLMMSLVTSFWFANKLTDRIKE